MESDNLSSLNQSDNLTDAALPRVTMLACFKIIVQLITSFGSESLNKLKDETEPKLLSLN